ncbi:unnamed protein product [Medioppia subpectinata]|uniref:Chitin-binding type-2 domain-containing protein n=1 Tax=Medioppia subpectinata TaxID=1979941 RepID=A0A7R9PZ50_9ACAR|nr:unnamed protein product [Medioppia subpectinata]CAG2106709.1 unnamed protein product [Medioppia subpectinata]
MAYVYGIGITWINIFHLLIDSYLMPCCRCRGTGTAPAQVLTVPALNRHRLTCPMCTGSIRTGTNGTQAASALYAVNLSGTENGLFANPNDCNTYYECYDSRMWSRNCRPGLHWNPIIETCDYPNKAVCDDERRKADNSQGKNSLWYY